MLVNQSPKRSGSYIFKITLVASVGGFLFGYDLVIIAGALPYLSEYFQLSPAMKGLAVSSAILGSIAGPLFGFWFTERLGRRKTMMIASFCFMISAVGSAFAFSIWDFAFWRFVGGIGIGLAMISSPIYIAELSPPEKRGSLVNVNQLSNVIGINLAVIAGYFLSFDGWGWRWMFGSAIIPTAFLLIGLLFIPESPRWLASKGRSDDALDILTKINGKVIAENELKEIKKELNQETGAFRELFQPGIKIALFIGIVLMIFSQINGVNMMLLYAPTILADAGISIGSNAILTSIPVYLFIFICTVIAFGLIKRFSRRGLLITSILFMALGHIIMAINLHQHWPPLFTLVPMLIGTGAFTLGFAPLSWIIVSEIFPNSVRAKGQTLGSLTHWVMATIITFVFPVISESLGEGVIFSFFCVMMVLQLFFVIKYMPETKGRSLEELETNLVLH